MRGTSFAAPQGTEENLNAIRGLQIPLESFPKILMSLGLFGLISLRQEAIAEIK